MDSVYAVLILTADTEWITSVLQKPVPQFLSRADEWENQFACSYYVTFLLRHKQMPMKHFNGSASNAGEISLVIHRNRTTLCPFSRLLYVPL